MTDQVDLDEEGNDADEKQAGNDSHRDLVRQSGTEADSTDLNQKVGTPSEELGNEAKQNHWPDEDIEDGGVLCI